MGFKGWRLILLLLTILLTIVLVEFVDLSKLVEVLASVISAATLGMIFGSSTESEPIRFFILSFFYRFYPPSFFRACRLYS